MADDIEPDDDRDIDSCCEHGIGFDEDCEWCDLYIAEERRAEAAEKKRQLELLAESSPSREAK